MNGLEPSYTNIIKQELEIGDLRRTVALVTGKLERLQQFVDRSEWGQERERLNARITELERDIEACQRSNAELLVCGAQNCEPYRDLQSQLAELTQGRNEAQQERQAEHDKFVTTNNSLDETTQRLAEMTQQYTAAIQHVVKLREQLEAQSVTYQDNLTEIQLLKAKLANEIANVQAHISTNTRLDHLVITLRAQLDTEVRKHHGTIDAANSAQTYIETLESHIRDKCEIYPGLSLHTSEDGIWLCFDGGGATGKKGMVHLGNHFADNRVVGPAVKDWLQRMKRWEEGTS